jgi:hypothetical protein
MMNNEQRSVLVFALFASLFVFALGCRQEGQTSSITTKPFPTGIELAFESVPLGGTGSNYDNLDGQIQVITNIARVSALSSLIAKPQQSSLLQVDYTRYMVILAFNGEQPQPMTINLVFEIQKVWQDNTDVYVQALFWKFIPSPGTNGALTVSDCAAVKVEKAALVPETEYNFHLLDQFGQERAGMMVEQFR